MSDVSAAVERGKTVLSAQRFRVQEARGRALKAGCCPCCGQLVSFETVAVSLDLNSVSFRGRTIFLTPTLTEMAFILAKKMPRPVRREYMFERLWGHLGNQDSKSMDVMIGLLRSRFFTLGITIETIRSVGWRVIVEEPDARS